MIAFFNVRTRIINITSFDIFFIGLITNLINYKIGFLDLSVLNT